MRLLTGLGALLLIGGSMLAAPKTERRAWEWPVEERIALRTDPAAASQRVSASRKGRRVEANQAQQQNIHDRFTGSTHPELFLPTEVFDELMKLAFLLKPLVNDSFRADMEPIVAGYGLPKDFWERLRNLSAIYMADANRAHDFPAVRKLAADSTQREREDFDREFNRNYELLCRSRVDALAKARQEFGAERFDRFLYGAIARNMFHTAFGPHDPQALRRLEAGCR